MSGGTMDFEKKLARLEEIVAKTKTRSAEEFVEIDPCKQILGRNPGGSKAARIVSGAFAGIGEDA